MLALKRGLQLLANGASGPLRGSVNGSLVVAEGAARFQEAVLAGNVWIGSNPSGTAVTSQAGVSATTPALTLYNPINSPVNLVLWSVGVAIQAAPAAAAAVMLAYNFPALAGVPTGPTTVTNGNVTNALISKGMYGSATAITTQGGSWGQVYRVSTLSAAPIAFRNLFGTTGAAAISGMAFRDSIEGQVIVPPGVAISVQTSSAASLVCDYVWEEVPIVA